MGYYATSILDRVRQRQHAPTWQCVYHELPEIVPQMRAENRKRVFCQYCASAHDAATLRCANCGAPIREEA